MSIFRQMQTQQAINSPAFRNSIAKTKQMMQMIKGMQNPAQMMQDMAKNNPQVSEVISMIQQSGKDPKDLFYEMAGKYGVDPEQIISMIS